MFSSSPPALPVLGSPSLGYNYYFSLLGFVVINLLVVLSVSFFHLGCLFPQAFGLLCDGCYGGLAPGARGWFAGCTGHLVLFRLGV